MSIEVRNITKTFNGFKALDRVSLKVPDGELVALLGPSGSGKTTLLRIIAGLEQPDSAADARVLFHEADVVGQHVGKRRVGFVFQHYALFRHMTVFDNISFGLRVRPRKQRPSQSDIRDRVHNLLKLIQLEGLENRYPSQLSGGQRQRIALARALAVEPRVLLSDEPFGALDAKVRQELRRWLRRLHDEIHVTSVFVTHDQEEALEVADRIVVMNHGHIEQVGTPEEVFHKPATEFVINFLGNVNLFHGRVEGGQAIFGAAALEFQGSTEGGPAEGKKARFFVRPHELDILPKPDGRPGLHAKIDRINSAGPHVKIELTSDAGDPIQVDLPHQRFQALKIAAGDKVFVSARDYKVFQEDFTI